LEDQVLVHNAKYRCKWGLKGFELVHFLPLPEVVENLYDGIGITLLRM